MENEKPPPKDIGTGSEECFKPATWSDIGKKWGVTRQRVLAVHDQMVVKLQDIFLDDPYIRDWLEENDFDIAKLDREKLRRSNARLGRNARKRSQHTGGS
tara:strand:- start:81 stop:380 length:300 start_codon:yes stop_codon:yes gene_type:complete